MYMNADMRSRLLSSIKKPVNDLWNACEIQNVAKPVTYYLEEVMSFKSAIVIF